MFSWLFYMRILKKLKRVFQKSSLPISVEVLPSPSISLQVINLPLNPKDFKLMVVLSPLVMCNIFLFIILGELVSYIV